MQLYLVKVRNMYWTKSGDYTMNRKLAHGHTKEYLEKVFNGPVGEFHRLIPTIPCGG